MLKYEIAEMKKTIEQFEDELNEIRLKADKRTRLQRHLEDAQDDLDFLKSLEYKGRKTK